MEFKEFNDPLDQDYDITSSLSENENKIDKPTSNQLIKTLIDLVGFLEDDEWEKYGITFEEYLNPSEEVIERVRAKINSDNTVLKTK